MKKGEYKCAVCKVVFKGDRSDEEAIEESKELFGNVPMEELEVVCGDCFKKMGLDK